MSVPTLSDLAPVRTERPSAPVPSHWRHAKGRSWRRVLRRQLLPVALVLPALGLLALMIFYPLGRLVATSFQNLGPFQLISHKVVWDGLANYRSLFTSSDLGTSVLQTFLFVLACVGLTMTIGTGVALLLGRIGKLLRTVVTICMLFVWAMPTSAASIVWTWLFQTEYGVVNYVLTSLGGNFANHNWFNSTLPAYSIIVANIVWGAIPFVALMMYSAFSLVPRELFEAAAVDGASPATTFLRVTLPMVRPIFVLLTVLSIIWDANVFNQVWYLTQGNAQLLNVIPLGVWQYIEAFSSNEYGLGAAVAVLMILLLVAVTGYYIRIMVRTGQLRTELRA
ncbi:MAG TPA: sugar ABC transporter permease [Acidimicrobiales bacterium]|nr:sugar ABC transporter permease [Acidimicrobiales bacterium]